MSWLRLKDGIKCGICKKPDYCMIGDRGDSFLCMRVPSQHPYTMRDGSVGYIHKLDGAVQVVPPRKEKPKPTIDWKEWWSKLRSENKPEWLEGFARELGVSFSSLVYIDVLWSKRYQAWAFPMKDGYEQIVGVRLRSASSKKWAIPGSKNALFIPQFTSNKRLYIFEGPTDLAAAITFGLNAIGRPSCSAGLFDIITLCSRIKPREVVIVADSDKVGLEGAATLSRHLQVKNCTITLPCKDMRQFTKDGGTARMLNCMVDCQVWNQPNAL